MAERKSVSMQDLADKLGISKVTVSKALNGKDGVGEELKEKIFALARESGYVLPDYGKRKSKKVGIIMSPRFSSGDEGKFYMAMYERIIYELQRASCSSIMISPTTATLPSDMNTIQTSGLFDGLIFLGILDKGVREQIAQIDLPKVYVDIYDRTHKSDSVITENIYSSYELTNYLIQQGHTDIGFVGTVGSTTSISDRYLGYLRRMLEEGISPKNEWRIPVHYTKEWVPDLECNKDRPDDQFKPYGATPGHGIEWARLITQWALSTYKEDKAGAAPYIEAAENLYNRAVADAWNADGAPGICYTTDWNGKPVVHDRMHWTLAEAINTSSVLFHVTDNEKYAADYAEFMKYLDEKVLDHVNGSWFHQLDRENNLLETVWPGKSDIYHALQATLIPYYAPGLSIAVAVKIKQKYFVTEKVLTRYSGKINGEALPPHFGLIR